MGCVWVGGLPIKKEFVMFWAGCVLRHFSRSFSAVLCLSKPGEHLQALLSLDYEWSSWCGFVA